MCVAKVILVSTCSRVAVTVPDLASDPGEPLDHGRHALRPTGRTRTWPPRHQWQRVEREDESSGEMEGLVGGPRAIGCAFCPMMPTPPMSLLRLC
jgi:hypothetical protein